MAKVMHLVDPKQLQRMDQMMTPVQRTISRLDEEMERILNRSDISDSQKVSLYNQVLQRYLEYQDRPIHPQTAPPPETAAKDIDGEVFMTVPKTLRRKAEALLYRLKNDPTFNWNERGELIYRGQIIPGSNMTDLINDTLRQRKTFQPHGWQEFARALRHGNVPQDLVGHRQRWDWMHRESATSDAFSTAEESPDEEPPSRSREDSSLRKSRSRTKKRTRTRERSSTSVGKSTVRKKFNWDAYK